ncbi:hypothetical protein ARSEF4850_004561 [Beauveria asiatica]
MWRSIDKPHTLNWLSSKQFKFVVGPEGQEFTVHSALVAEQSKPLHALVTNGMKESLEATVKWPHVDVATFKKFSEYLYTGDFVAPGFEPIATIIAKLYTFAHYYDIQQLKRFCQAKIHSLMALAPGREEVCELLQFCETDPGGRGLKELVVEYCALNLRWLLASKKFHTLIEEYPKASLGIMKKLSSFNTFYFERISKSDIDFPGEISSDSEADWYRERAED